MSADREGFGEERGQDGLRRRAQTPRAVSEVQRPLAVVVIGGLVTSPCLTLLVLPILHGWLEEWRGARLAAPSHALDDDPGPAIA